MPSSALATAVPFGWDDPPRVIAHCGAPREATENTLASFRAALAGGARAVELDVHLSADDEVMVHHAPALGRVIPGRGRLDEKTSGELRALGVPTLADVLAALPRDALVDVEMKADLDNCAKLPARVMDAVKKTDALDRALVTSFDPALAAEYAKLAQHRAGAIVPFPVAPADLADFPDLAFVAMAADALSPALVREHRDAGRRVLAWTVNDVAAARRLLAMGCASVITDEAARFVRELGA